MGIYEWVSAAVSYIPFKGDRDEVSAELRAHFEDHRDALIASGLDRQNAERRALEAMGDPDETGRMLRKVHRPWLGLLWILSRWALGIALALCIISWLGGGRYNISRLWQGYPKEAGFYYPIGTRDYLSGDSREFVKTGSCGEKAKAGSYTVRVENVTALRAAVKDSEDTYDTVFFLVRIDGPLWLGFPENIRWFVTAEDSFGTVYANGLGRGIRTYDPVITGNPIGRRLGAHYLEMWLNNCDAEAEWYELRYDHGGVSFVLKTEVSGEAVQ